MFGSGNVCCHDPGIYCMRGEDRFVLLRGLSEVESIPEIFGFVSGTKMEIEVERSDCTVKPFFTYF
ncbi:hypothetical protein RJ53_01925 [Methanocalculus chunghsingensis]|uniref:Uncharacterized protein n=1 Tax=Methanocalculus chunghsingensis TaxID=156457 RepID=A0A8J8B3L0_9EURY|nr:hypothetical protein [Methanocalculus chunghsingensis]